MKILRLATNFLALLSFMATPAMAQVAMPSVKVQGNSRPATGTVQVDSAGNDATDTANHALRINCITGCSGGGNTTVTATAAAPTYTEGSISNPLSVNLSGDLRTIAKQSGTWTVGVSGSVAVTGTFWQATQPVSIASMPSTPVTGTFWQTTQPVSAVLGTTNGWTPKLANALSTTVVSVKASAGTMGMLQCYNPNSSQVYVQIFNVASGSVTLGTSTPSLSIPIGGSATGGWALSNPGVNFSTAISIAATTTATGSTAPSTAVDCNVAYN